MTPIRILVVDDSVVVRRLLRDALEKEPDIEVVGVAANGNIALQKIPQCNPDLVTLDIEMPELDGLSTLKEIRKTYKRLPVIMFSTLTERGGSATLEALAIGASDYVTKPANVGSVQEGFQRIRADLAPKIRYLVHPQPVTRIESLKPKAESVPAVARVPRRSSSSPGTFDVIAIGCSTGGPNALAELIPALPGDLPVPVVIAQHMPPLFTKMLADRLSNLGEIPVHEGAAGTVLEPATAYLAPGDYHMVLSRRSPQSVVVELNKGPRENSCRPAVDPLFRSVADAYGGNVLAVMLTGMGHDGLRGSEYIHERGGRIIAQDKASSVVWSMPGAVVEAGFAERVLPLGQLAEAMIQTVRAKRNRPSVPERQGLAS